MEYKEVESKTIHIWRYGHSPFDAHAVTVHLTKRTRVHIGHEPLLKVDTELDKIKDGDRKVIQNISLGSPVS